MAYEQQIRELAGEMAASLLASGKKNVAVVDFTDLQGNATELGRFLAEELSVALTRGAKGFKVVDRTHLKAILQEHKLSSSGLIDSTTARKLGQIAGVEALATGTVTPFGDSVRLSVKVLDTATAEMIGAATTEIPKTKAIEELLNREIAGGAGPSVSSSSRSVTAAAAAAERIDEEEFTFELRRCTRSKSRVICEMVVTNRGAERELTLQGDDVLRASSSDWSRAFDDAGNEYVAREVQLANSSGGEARKPLIPGVATRAALIFQGVAPGAKSFRVLDVGCYVRRLTTGAGGGIGGILSDRMLGGRFRVRFEEVPISQ